MQEQEVLCKVKVKEQKQHEFVNKSSFGYIRTSGVIVRVMAIEGNAYTRNTLNQS
jgi:hypothetical protein